MAHVAFRDTMAYLTEIEDPPPPKINNASLADLKATSDDAIAPVSHLNISG
jgi:hypothetical protein